MKNAKYNYLKNYLKRTKTAEDKDIEACFDFLSMFYDDLPERTKGRERRQAWSILVNQIITAFDKQLEKIASCPFVKIEISDQQDIKDILTSLKTYADIDFIKSATQNQIKIEQVRYDNNDRV